MKFGALISSALIAAFAFSTPSFSQDTRRHLGSFRDWEAFVYGTGAKRTCHMISTPKSSRASKRNVRRGEIYIMVSHRPEYGVKDEVNLVFGYPVRQGSDASFSVDGRRRLSFFTEGNSAWAYDPKDDRGAVASMKRGNRLEVKATSQRGTNTTDNYSLSGFTAAYNAITQACR